MRKVFICFLAFLLFYSQQAFASSQYVLPYPSFMPGNKLYKPRLVLKKISSFLYFGDFGQFKYNLGESDHYLVEEKVLFEYGQYLLAFSALKKSDNYFAKTLPNLKTAEAHGKKIKNNKEILKNAALKHVEVLENLKTLLPEKFYWDPEKAPARNIEIRKALEESIKIREEAL